MPRAAVSVEGPLRAALGWPIVGWLVGSWLDEPARDRGPRTRRPRGIARHEVSGWGATARLGLSRGIAVALLAVILCVPPVAAGGAAPPVPARAPHGKAAPAAAAAISVGGATREPSLASQQAVQAAALLADRAMRLRTAWPRLDGRSEVATDRLVTRATLQAPLLARAGAPPKATGPVTTYRTVAGDTVWSIARRFSVSQRTIWWANDVPDVQVLRRGQLLKLLPTSGVIYYVHDGDTLDSIARTYRVSASSVAHANALVGGVVLLGQRLLIPGGVGPRYEPRVPDSVTTADALLWPRGARHGELPTVGAALAEGGSAASAAGGVGVKTMQAAGATASDTGSVPVADSSGGAEGSDGVGLAGSIHAPLRSLPGRAATVDQGPRQDRSSAGMPIIKVRVIRVPGSTPITPQVGTTGSGGVAADRRDLPASGAPKGAAAIGPRPTATKVTIGSPRPSAPTVATTSAGSPPAFSADAAGDVNRVVVDLSKLFTTQFDGSVFANTNCTMAAGAMLYEVQTGLDVSGAQMRAWSSDTTRYTSPSDLARAFAAQGQPLSVHYDLSWRHFLHEMRSGRSAVVMGWYGYLPRRLSLQPGFTGAHAIFVLTYSRHAFRGRGGFYVMDPLGRAGYAGQWWPAGVLHAYAWSGIPGRHRSDRLSFFGDVAFQANRTPKHAGGKLVRPTFRDYWQTTKEVLDSAIQVTIRSHGHTDQGSVLRGTLLIIDDPALDLSPARAAGGALGWPIGAAHRLGLSFAPGHRSVDIRAAPGSLVRAAAAGRIVYLDWPGARGGQSIWIEHGPRLYTAYHGLDGIEVAPGQWVDQGDVIGRVAGSGASGRLGFSVMVGSRPDRASTRVDPRRYLQER